MLCRKQVILFCYDNLVSLERPVSASWVTGKARPSRPTLLSEKEEGERLDISL
jgi:hypothetical protein